MEELSEIHLLPEELEEYSKFSRMMNLLKKLRLKRQANLELEAEAEQAMKNMQQSMVTQPVAPSAAGLSAAPVAPQPEPISQVAMPKPVNAKLEPLTTENKDMSVRVAAASPNNPFERMLMRKFAALADEDGVPSLEEAAALGIAGLAGTSLGSKLAPVGSRWMAQEALGPHFGAGMSEIDDLLNDSRLGFFGSRGAAIDRLNAAAHANKLRGPGTVLWGTDRNIKSIAHGMENELTHKLTKSKIKPFKVLGGIGALLGTAALLKNRNNLGQASAPEASSVGLYPEQMPVDMGGQY